MSLNVTVITELGGYTRKNHRHAEGRGNTQDRHVNQVCRHPGGEVSDPVSPPVNGGQHIQKYSWPSPRFLSPGHPIRRAHHGSADGAGELTGGSDPQLRAREPCWGRFRVLALQPHVPGEGPSLLLQRVLHPERLPAGWSRHSRAPPGPVNKILPNRDDHSGSRPWSMSWCVCMSWLDSKYCEVEL